MSAYIPSGEGLFDWEKLRTISISCFTISINRLFNWVSKLLWVHYFVKNWVKDPDVQQKPIFKKRQIKVIQFHKVSKPDYEWLHNWWTSEQFVSFKTDRNLYDLRHSLLRMWDYLVILKLLKLINNRSNFIPKIPWRS